MKNGFTKARLSLKWTVGVVLVCLLNHPVFAAEYSIESRYSAVVRYDDNFRVSTGASGDNDLFRGELSSDWAFAKATETSSLTGRFALDTGTFNDRFDRRFALGYQSNTVRGNWSVNASFDDDSIRRSEESEEGSGQFSLANTGAEFYNLSARWGKQLDERNSLTWNTGGSSRRFETEQINDTDFVSTSLRWQHSVSNRFRLQILTSYSYFNSDDVTEVINPDLNLDAILSVGGIGFTVRQICAPPNQISNLPAAAGGNGMSECRKERARENTQLTFNNQLGVFYVVNEHLSIDALAGYASVDSELFDEFNDILPSDSVADQTIDSTNGNISYNVEVIYNQDTLDYRLFASSRESANSSGILTENTEIRLETSKRFDDRRLVRLNFYWLRQESFVGDISFLGREVARVVALYQYSLYQNWTIIGEVRYLNQKRQGIASHIESSQGILTVRWQPTTLKWSR